MEKKSIVQWCKNLDEAGNELKLSWSGGGDSGWAEFLIDGEIIDNEYTRALVDRIYDILDYGSWAGEFNADGTAVYDAEKNAFEGTDYYGEDENDYEDIDITITIPKKLWFESLHVEVEASYEDTPDISVRFIIKNGFLTDEHSEICSNLEETLKDEFDHIFSNYSSSNGAEFRHCSEVIALDRADAIESGDNLIFKIKQIEFSVMSNIEKPIVLTLDEETAVAIDEQLNDE
jgi:hypothetical protein